GINHPSNADDFRYYKVITIDNTKVSGTGSHANFPVLISLFDSDLRIDVQSDGDDIAFSNGTDWLDHEIEAFNQTYNNTHAQLVAWVRIPSLSSSVDTNITMYYGNSTMTAQENPAAVWDSNYAGVWHLSENPTGTIYDSTSNDQDGTSSGSMTSDDQMEGQIDGSLDFDGTDDYINVGDVSSDAWTAITVEAWIYHYDIGDDRVLSKSPTTATDSSIFALLVRDNKFRVRMSTDGVGGTDSTSVDALGSHVLNTWQHFAFTWDSLTETITIFVDSVNVTSEAKDGDTIKDSSQVVIIGNANTTADRYYNGIIDEVRISKVTHSAGWIATEYNNQNDPDSFYSISEEQNVGIEDILPPHWDNLIESGDPLELGNNETISIDVTDASGINVVYLEYDGINHTMYNTVSDTYEWTNWQPSSIGVKDYKIYMKDNNNNWNETNTLDITVQDTTDPTWDEDPTDQVIVFGQSFSYDVNASDLSGIDHYTVNDTLNFQIDGNGLITNKTALLVGKYWLNISAFDPSNNYCDKVIQITVQVSTDPTWDEDLSDQVIEFGDPFSYDVNASDLSGIDHYTVNGTIFDVDGSGVITNITALLVGSYWLNISAFDPSNNYCEDIILITVQDTTDPTWDEDPTDQVIEFGQSFSYDVNASDLSGIDHYTVNGTIFDVDGSGVITNITALTVGSYWLNISAFDPSNNYCEDIILITVQDTTDPTWDEDPTDQVIVFGQSFSYDVNASDLSGIDHYTVNGTIFDVDGSGVITNITALTVGSYRLNISAFDPSNNYCEDIILITVQDTTVIDTPPPSPSPAPAPVDDKTPPTYSDLIESVDPLEIGNILIISINVSDVSGINQVLIEFDGANHSMTYISGNMWQYDSWNISSVGHHNYTIYMEDKSGNWNSINDTITAVDTIPPLPPTILSCPEGEVNGVLVFDWADGEDHSGILYYRLIIDTEANAFTTAGYVFEINLTNSGSGSSYYKLEETLEPDTYYFFIYQIDGAGHQSNALTGNFSIISSSQPSQPSEFPLWIIIVIIGAAIGGVLGLGVLKKSKSKKLVLVEIPKKLPVSKHKLEIREELKLLDYETLKNKSRRELNAREKKLLDYIKYLEENKDYNKAAEFLGELIIIEEILANTIKAKSYCQKQIDIAVKGLDYLKDQYEKESKKAAISGDYSKALELYKESQ
ncbi:hypothetical protein LCGC14_1552070, partial [marine sediment metagenome]